MANPKLDKVKKGTTVMTEEQKAFWAENDRRNSPEGRRIRDSIDQAQGAASTARVRALREDIEARAEDGIQSVDYKSQEELKKKRDMARRRNAMNAADSLSRGGM